MWLSFAGNVYSIMTTVNADNTVSQSTNITLVKGQKEPHRHCPPASEEKLFIIHSTAINIGTRTNKPLSKQLTLQRKSNIC